MYPELEMFAPCSPEENGIRGYPQGYGIRENALVLGEATSWVPRSYALLRMSGMLIAWYKYPAAQGENMDSRSD